MPDLREILDRAYSPDEYPVLAWQAERWRVSRPLAGTRVLDATPVFGNTLAKYLPLVAGGADLTVFLSPLLPHDPHTVELLAEAGIPVTETATDCDIALDCAGVLAKTESRLGHVELTKSGERAYRRHPKTVFLVDDSRTKVIETSLGTGDGFVRGMAHFGHADLTDKSVVVFGGGKVGRGAAMRARDAGARVTIIDPDPQVRAPQGCTLASELPDDAWCVVTATGHPSALEPWCERLIASDAILANLGAEDEFGPRMPRERVLNDKAPVNFALAEPTRLRYLDAVMALDNACGLALRDGHVAPGIQPPPRPLEDEILGIVRTRSPIAGELAALEESP